MRILGLMLLVAAGVYLSTSSSGTKKLRSQIGNQSNIGITHYQEGMAAKNWAVAGLNICATLISHSELQTRHLAKYKAISNIMILAKIL